MSSDFVNAASASTQRVDARIPFFSRLKRAFGPVLPGLVLDLADFFSLTRTVGPWVSFPMGFAIGIWLSLFYPFGLGWRCVIAFASGLYTFTPGTEYIPLATILTCLGRFIENTPAATSAPAADATAIHEATPDSSAEVGEQSRRKRTTQTRAACPECGSASLRYGQVAQRFWPAGSGLWAKGHEINAFVCLECGFIGHYLASADLEQLREANE